MIPTGTAEDPLGLTDTDAPTISSGGATGIRTVRRSTTDSRVNWGNAIDTGTQGPTLGTEGSLGPDYQQAPDGPVTLAHTYTMMRDADLVAIRIYKAPDLAGTIDFGVWDDAGTLLGSESVAMVADDGGWVEVPFSPTVALTDGEEYTFGYLSPGNDYAYSTWVVNGLDYITYPFRGRVFTETGAGVKAHGNARTTGASLTFPSVASDRSPANYYVDPIVEWEETLPGYDGSADYFAQFENGGSNFAFPIAVWWPEADKYDDYEALGFNTIMAGPPDDDKAAAIIATGLDWYPALHTTTNGLGDMTAVVMVQEDPALAAHVVGYHLTDEPDLQDPYNDPDTVLAARNEARVRDSTRPIIMGLSYLPVKNQSFIWNPDGATPLVVNQVWRDFGAIPDIFKCDFYSLAGTDSYQPSSDELSGDSWGRYGIWAYPRQIQRMRELTDDSRPIWGIVEATSQVPSRPTPDQVEKAIWALLIAGARGILYFNHRFASSSVSQDFNTILNEPAMGAMCEALNAQLVALGPALLAAEADLLTDVTWTNTTEGPIGGTYGVPIHYTTRQAGGVNYLFAQAIRPGGTDATFTVPSAASKTVTVIGESRTVAPDGSGVFTDTFAETGEHGYEYHLYSWTP